jgi:hypothetical protein
LTDRPIKAALSGLQKGRFNSRHRISRGGLGRGVLALGVVAGDGFEALGRDLGFALHPHPRRLPLPAVPARGGKPVCWVSMWPGLGWPGLTTAAARSLALAEQTRAQLDKLAVKHDLPLHTLG